MAKDRTGADLSVGDHVIPWGHNVTPCKSSAIIIGFVQGQGQVLFDRKVNGYDAWVDNWVELVPVEVSWKIIRL